MDLEAIPGVGEKTANALSELDAPDRALREADVAALARAPGISEGRAARIARAAIRHEHGGDGEFLATARAREVYRSVLELLQEWTVTDYAARRVETFYPTGTESRIEEVRAFAREATDRDPDDGVREALVGVEPLDSSSGVTVRDRCVATTDAERYAEAQSAVPEMSVELVDDGRDLDELARGYSTVVALDEAFAGTGAGRDADGEVRVKPDALERPGELVPERTLSFFATNRDRIRAAAAVHRRSDLEPPCDPDHLEEALDRLAEDGTIAGDEELDRLSAAIEDLDAAVSTAESVADDRLREAIRERDVTIEGADLLSLVERGAGADSLLSRELADEYDRAIETARDHLVDALSLSESEADLARRAFPDDPTFPVETTDATVSRLREELTVARDRRASRLKQDLASDLADLRDPVEQLVRAALELDVKLAVARFAREFDCTLPEFGGEGFSIDGGRSPLLDESRDAVEPVDYAVGGVAVLSGVNSGGKTSTLDLVASVVVLAHMGLPVPADRVRVERIDRLYYHAKTQGTLDAGAFESTVREFAAVARDGDGLVLVDELESITEPGASATIIAGILEALDGNDAAAVFVSHLADEIREECGFEVTVDGIEAEGLADGELQVNRSPVKDHLARSTPELIVEKLAEESGEAFYDRLLEKFDGE